MSSEHKTAAAMADAWPLPAAAGLGLKLEHAGEILETDPAVGFFEVHAENYMGAGGPPHRYLDGDRARAIRCRCTASACRSAARAPLDRAHLARLKALIDRYRPASFSEHLAWSTHESAFFNDLLPLPYTPATLERVIAHVDEAQQTLGVRMLLENPSTYRAVRRIHHRRDRLPDARFPSAPAAACCSTSTTSWCRRSITASTPSPISTAFRWSGSARSIWPAMTRRWTRPASGC